MAEGKIVEQPKIEKPSAIIAPVKRPEFSAGFSERISPKIEKPKEIAKPQPANVKELTTAVSPAQVFQKQQAAAIDSILAEGLNEIFLKMPPADQAKFKKQGEETVVKINKLLSQTRIQVNKIINLIRKWLQLIPGVNKFFLEQEAKLKADKIIRLKDR
jgi:hypothetical protein